MLGLTEDAGDDIQPAWSSDNRHIAFVSDRDGSPDIWVMNSDGSDQNQLTHHPWTEFYPSWSQDGEKLAFASNWSGNWDIRVMNLTYPSGEVSFQPITSEIYVGRSYNVSIIVKNYEDFDINYTARLDASENDFQILNHQISNLVSANSQQLLSFEVIPDKKGNITLTVTLFLDSKTLDSESHTINVKQLAKISCYPSEINKTGNPGESPSEVLTIENEATVVAETIRIEKKGDIATWIDLNSSSIGSLAEDQTVRIYVKIDIPEKGVLAGEYNGLLIISGKNIDPIEVPIILTVITQTVWEWLEINSPYIIGAIATILAPIISAILLRRRKEKPVDQQKKIEIFRDSKRVLGKSSRLLKGHLRHLKEEGDKYPAKSRIPGEIENIIKHSSILSSIGDKTEKKKIKPILEKGAIYSKLATTQQFLMFSNEIREWANKANSIQIDLS